MQVKIGIPREQHIGPTIEFQSKSRSIAAKRLNCEYSGPPKTATANQLDVLQEICPHLVEEVTLLVDGLKIRFAQFVDVDFMEIKS